MEKIIVAGKPLNLTLLDKKELKGVFVDAILGFSFYKTAFNGNDFYLLISKRETKLAPLEYKQLADRLQKILAMPIVFLFDRLLHNERNRLIDRGVYFIVSDKYTYLPYLIINAKQADKKPVEMLTPAAQYILLFHLQKQSMNGLTINEIESQTPYKYITLTRAITCLEQLKLCRSEKGIDKKKRIYFDGTTSALWERAQAYIWTPIKSVHYCDEISINDLTICGVNALAHYSHLNPEAGKMIAMDDIQFKELSESATFKGLNQTEGNVKIEVWKYPPITADEPFVDKLSLYLTLKEDKDPRVEKELEIMIKELW